MIGLPVFADVLAAAERLAGGVHRTPVLTCASLDALCGARLFLKAENLQKAGAFKFRGALNAVLQLTPEEARRGVATHSSGNHAQALALAAGARGIAARLVMPLDAPAAKRRAALAYGGTVVPCGATLESREAALKALLAETGAIAVHGYDDPRVIAGAGTAALELSREVPELDAILVPLGGGGLASGTALAAHGISPRLRVWGVEPELADDAYESLERGRPLPPRPPLTLADGLRTCLSERTFAILREELEGVLRVSDGEIVAAMRLLWHRAKTVVEPSGAVGLAAALRERERFRGQRVGIILSGGNLDWSPARLSEYFERPLPEWGE